MKKTAIILAIVILAVVIGSFIFYQQSQPKSLGKVVLGWNVWPGVLPYLIADNRGFFKAEGVDVTMVVDSDYTKLLSNLVAGKIDGSGDIVLIDAADEIRQGNKLKIILATDYSNGADGIVAKKNIETVAELKNKKVAVEIGTVGEYLLYDALGKSNLSLADVQEINLSAQDSAQAFVRGEVDAAVTYEPDFTQAVNGGGGRRLYTSADSPGLIIDVLAFNSDFVTANPAKVAAVVRAYFKAVDFINNNPDQAYKIGAKYFGITASELQSQMKEIKQMNLNDNIDIFSYQNNASSLHWLLKQAYDFLQKDSADKTQIDSTEIIDPQFVRELIK